MNIKQIIENTLGKGADGLRDAFHHDMMNQPDVWVDHEYQDIGQTRFLPDTQPHFNFHPHNVLERNGFQKILYSSWQDMYHNPITNDDAYVNYGDDGFNRGKVISVVHQRRE